MQWSSVLLEQYLVTVKQTENDVLFCAHGKEDDDDDEEDQIEVALRDYFQLDRVNLTELYAGWSRSDPHHFGMKATQFKGIRMLRINPAENLFSFICSTNNNIPRITQMVQNICRNFGELIDDNYAGHSWYSFPSIYKLHDSEQILRELKFGYRAKYIAQTARLLVDQSKLLDMSPEAMLLSMRDKSYNECRDLLMSLSGVGPKVADCVCLMSMDKAHVIPVDTHVRTIAERDYKIKLTPIDTVIVGKKRQRQMTDNSNGKVALTPHTYRQIQVHFEELFGEYAGWAHSVLFTADLKWKLLATRALG